MKHVSRLWLRRFQFALVALDIVVVGVYLYMLLTGSGTVTQGEHGHGAAHSTVPSWGITALPASLAALHAIYTLGVVWWLDRRYTWAAHAAGVLVSGSVLVLLANSDSPMHVLYHAMLMCFMFFASMAGTLPVGLILAATFTFLIISSLGPGHLTTDPAGHVIEMILVSFSALSASAGWFVFNKRYIQKADVKVVENLTRLIKQERSTVSLILESITDGVMILNTKGEIQVLNANSAKMLGWTKEEAQNLQYDYLLQPMSASDDTNTPDKPPTVEPLAIAQTLQTGKPDQRVSLIKIRDGRQVYMDIAASPIFQEETIGQGTTKKLAGVIAVLRDVDKQKREEQQRSEFISTASHEMRTPVAAIEGYLALAMNDKVSRIDNKARSYLEKAHESTQHLGKLFQDLLTSAKAEDGRLVSHPTVVEMGDYLQRLTDSLRFAAQKKGLLVDFTIGTSTPGDQDNGVVTGKVIKPLYYVFADPDRLREVITNLFDNAVKYTGEGKISIGLTGNNDVVQFYIRDTGPGIPPEDLPHLFQKFYRVDNSATRTIGGTGLGLFISRKIVELYKGRIWAESEINKGSTFYINFPRLSTENAGRLQTAEAAKAQTASPLG